MADHIPVANPRHNTCARCGKPMDNGLPCASAVASQKLVSIIVYVSPEDRAELERLAVQEYGTVSQLVRSVVGKWLQGRRSNVQWSGTTGGPSVPNQ